MTETDDEFGAFLDLINAKISALMEQAAELREARKDEPEFTNYVQLSVAEIAVQLAAVEIVALETDEPDPDKLREWVSKHARALRNA